MSWRPMNYNDSYKGDRWSTELILYVDNVKDEDRQWLFWLAILPFIDNFVLGHGHTVKGNEAIYDNSQLCDFLFLETIVREDSQIFNEFDVPPYPTELLWVVPLTSSEYEEKITNGLDSILDIFEKHQHPIVLDRNRKSYIQHS